MARIILGLERHVVHNAFGIRHLRLILEYLCRLQLWGTGTSVVPGCPVVRGVAASVWFLRNCVPHCQRKLAKNFVVLEPIELALSLSLGMHAPACDLEE